MGLQGDSRLGARGWILGCVPGMDAAPGMDPGDAFWGWILGMRSRAGFDARAGFAALAAPPGAGGAP